MKQLMSLRPNMSVPAYWFNRDRVGFIQLPSGFTLLGVTVGKASVPTFADEDFFWSFLDGNSSDESECARSDDRNYLLVWLHGEWADVSSAQASVWPVAQGIVASSQVACGSAAWVDYNPQNSGHQIVAQPYALFQQEQPPTRDIQPDCGPYKVRLLLDIPVVDSDDPEGGEKEYLLSGNCLQGEESFVKFEVQALQAAWKYKIRRIDLVLADGPFWGDVSWEAVDKNGNEAGEGSNIPNIGGGREITIEAPYASGIPLYIGGDNPASMVLDVFNNQHWLCLNVTLACGEPGEIGGTEPVPPEPPEEPVAPVEEEWPTGYGPEDDTLIIVEPPGEVTPPTIVTPPTTGTGPEGCECFEYLAGEIAIQAGYLGEILESVRQEVFISRRENNELLLRIETAILQEAAKNRNNLILRGLELLERVLGMNVDLGPLIAELSDGRSQSATNADTMKQAIEGLATAIEEASCCEPICERLDKIAKGVYFDEVVGEENRSLAMNTNLLLAGLNIWK